MLYMHFVRKMTSSMSVCSPLDIALVFVFWIIKPIVKLGMGLVFFCFFTPDALPVATLAFCLGLALQWFWV